MLQGRDSKGSVYMGGGQTAAVNQLHLNAQDVVRHDPVCAGGRQAVRSLGLVTPQLRRMVSTRLDVPAALRTVPPDAFLTGSTRPEAGLGSGGVTALG